MISRRSLAYRICRRCEKNRKKFEKKPTTRPPRPVTTDASQAAESGTTRRDVFFFFFQSLGVICKTKNPKGFSTLLILTRIWAYGAGSSGISTRVTYRRKRFCLIKGSCDAFVPRTPSRIYFIWTKHNPFYIINQCAYSDKYHPVKYSVT